MSAELRTIDIEPGSENARLLGEVSGEPVVLTIEGERFRLVRLEPVRSRGIRLKLATPEEISRPPTPVEVERSIAGTRAAAGSWIGQVDSEEFTAYIRKRRLTKNRPVVRW